MTKILVTGSRDWTDRDLIRRAFQHWPKDTLFIDGAAPGADTLVYEITKEMGFLHHARFLAQWRKYGPKAGPRRNRLMFDTTQPDYVIAFPLPQSKGTWGMMGYARSRGCIVLDATHEIKGLK